MVKSLKRSLVLSCVLAMFLPTVASADVNVSRISGANRYDTAMKVQQMYFKKASGNQAVLASGTDFRTALYGSYMANSFKVPFYTVHNNGISNDMLREFKNKKIRKVNIMGDYKQVNQSIEKVLTRQGIKVARYYDKYENGSLNTIDHYISTDIFNALHPDSEMGDINTGIVINDQKYPDLLSAIPFVSSLAREEGTFLSGTREFGVEGPIEGFRFVIGGKDSVSPNIGTSPGDGDGLKLHGFYDETTGEEKFDQYSYYTGRIAGQNRYKTAIEIAKAYKLVLKKNINTVVLVDGTNYPDALASGTVATMNNGVVLLTEPGRLNEDTKKFIKENNIKKVIIVGGEKSVSKNVENELRGIR